jgi:hypothetical protein
MKLLYVLLISLLVSLCKADNCTEFESPKNPSDCHSLNISKGYIKCCYSKSFYYYKGELTNETACQHLNQEDYDTIPKRIKTKKAKIELFGGIIEQEILDCKSKYLYSSLLLLMILLL